MDSLHKPISPKHGKKPRIRWGLILIFLFFIFGFGLEYFWNPFHRIENVSRAHENWGLDEIIVGLLFLAIGLSLFSFRRWLELRREIRERRQAEEALQKALAESTLRQAEISALLESSRAVLAYHEFKDAARAIFDACKKLIGATSGYIALSTKSEIENELLFLDAGNLSCTVDPAQPMPIRGLRGVAYQEGKTVFENDFPKSPWVEFMPAGHAPLENVLFAPLIIHEKTVGLLGLANKPGGFTENDARLASAFGEHGAISLMNSRALETLETSEEHFRSVAQTASDAIITLNHRGEVVFWNPEAEKIFGYMAEEMVGQAIVRIMPEPFREAHQKGMERVIQSGEANLIGRTTELIGLRKGGEEFPLELSLSNWKTKEGSFFTGILRDITVRKRMEKDLRQAREDLEMRVQERTANLGQAVKVLRAEINDRKRAEKALRESETELRRLSAELISAQEKERRKIARDLHDGIGQILSAAKFSLERQLDLNEKGQAPSRQALQPVIEQVQSSIEEVRRISSDLWPSILDDLGLLMAVNWFCRNFQGIYAAIQVEKEIRIQENEIPRSLKIVIYRVLQEAMNNVAKYSQTQTVQLFLQKADGRIDLRVKDLGLGFDLENATKGLGLASMKERTELAGGTFQISSTRGEGTVVHASWPV
jgi:PAS domain S-box-containing protein